MLIFRQDNKASGTIKALLAIAFGVFLIVTKANAMTLVVQVIAIGMMALGVIPVLLSLRYPVLQMLASGAFFRVLIGALLFYFAGPVSSVLRYFLGGLLCFFGLSQIMAIVSRYSLSRGFLPFILPVMTLSLGALFFSEELIGNDIMGLLAGIAFIMYGASKILSVFDINWRRKKASSASEDKTTVEHRTPGAGWENLDQGNVKDVDYKKVD